MDNLAEQIRADLAKVKQANNKETEAKNEWIEASLSLAQHLLDARNQHQSNNDFGEWVKTNELDVNEHDRKALIRMARELPLARIVLQETKRKSYQHIWSDEMQHRSKNRFDTERSAHASRTTEPETISKPKQKPRPEFDKAQKIIREAKETNQPINGRKIQKEHNISAGTFTAAKAAVEATEKAKEEIALEREWANLSEKDKKELQKYKESLYANFDAEVSKGIKKWSDEVGLSFHRKQLDEMKLMLTNPRNAVMYKTEYNTILRCLHTDTAFNRTKEQLEEAFRIFTHYKLKMINDAEERENAVRALHSSMPKTLAEMMARKTKKG